MSYATYIHVPAAVTIPSGTEQHKTQNILEYTQQYTRDSRHPRGVEAAREFPLSLCTES